MNLSGVGAVVTGGASGLGAATVTELEAAGAHVTVIDRELGVDVRDADAVAAVLADVSNLRVLVTCAGAGAPPMRTAGRRGPYPLDVFQRIVDINLVGTFNCARLAAAAMLDLEPLDGGERGVIVQCASVNAFDGPAGTAAYTAAKGAVAAMTLPMARDLAPFGVRVCTIAPGCFDTPMLRSSPPEFLEELQQTVPFPNERFGDPVEFARLARHICENQMLNGETIRLDGAVRMNQR